MGLTKKVLSTAKSVSKMQRYKSVSDTKLDELKKRLMKKRTFNKMQWGINTFKEWRASKLSSPDGFDVNLLEVDVDVVSSLTKEKLCAVLCKFVAEITKKDGSDYPGKTLYELICSIQKYPNNKNILWKLIDDPCFLDLKTVRQCNERESSS